MVQQADLLLVLKTVPYSEIFPVSRAPDTLNVEAEMKIK